MRFMQRRFVILRHKDYGPTHYDLMIQSGGVLVTWQFRVSPIRDIRELPCRRIADHREAYLEYEGPVSSRRGEVSQVDAGECRVRSQEAHRWQVEFDGQKLQGAWELWRVRDDQWALHPLPSL
jgi:hypothetical protein